MDVEYIKEMMEAIEGPPEIKSYPDFNPGSLTALSKDAQTPISGCLIEFLNIVNGAFIGGQSVFGIGTSSPYLEIATYYSYFPDWELKGWIPLGADGCGSYYTVISNSGSDSECPVVFMDESDIDMNGDYSISYVISSKPTLFLRFLLEYELGAKQWPFDRNYVVARDPEILRFARFSFPWDK